MGVLVGGLISLGLIGDTVSVNSLNNSTAFTVAVAVGTTQQITVSGDGDELAGVNLGSDKNLDLLIYKQVSNDATATLVEVQTNWLEFTPGITIPVVGTLLGSWSGADLQLKPFDGGATYYVVVGNQGNLLDLGVLTQINVQTESSILTSSAVTGEPASGNVIENDSGLGQSITVTTVDGNSISGSTIIEGEYGNLLISSNGDYTYTPFENTNGIGQTDEFEYTINDGSGNTDTAILSIEITSDYTPPAPAAVSMSASSFTLADDTDDAIELPDTSLITSTEGLDILSFDGANQVISLSDLIQPEVLDIIDISGIGANTLNVAANDIDSTIYVKGDSDDTVDLGNVGADLSDTDGSGNATIWINTQTTTSDADGQQYNVWALSTDSATQVNIDVDITNII